MKIKQLIILTSAVSILLTSISSNGAEKSTLSTLGCMLEPSKKVKISSPVTGIIETVRVKRGDSIKKGNTLFKLKAGVERENVALAKVRSEFAKRQVERNRALYKDDILSIHERDEIETEMKIAAAEYRLKKQELALRTVYSPINGVVVNRFNNTGEYVDIAPIIDLAILNPLHIDLLLPANYFGQIKRGQKLMIKPLSETIDARTAKVIIVDPLIDPASSTFRVQLVMGNPGNKIPAGIRCNAELINKS